MIGRLPEQVRDVLNRHILDGWSARKLIAWLHSRPAVIAVLDENFQGRRINDAVISYWRGTGYADWLRQREAREIVISIGAAEEAERNAPLAAARKVRPPSSLASDAQPRIEVGCCYVFMRDGHDWHTCEVAVLSVEAGRYTVARATDVASSLLMLRRGSRPNFKTWTCDGEELW